MPTSRATNHADLRATEQYLGGLRRIEAHLAERIRQGRMDYEALALRDRLIRIIREGNGG